MANDSQGNVLERYFSIYMRHVRKLSDASISKYFNAIRKCSKVLRERNLLTKDIYEVSDYEQLLNLKEILLQDPEFIEFNKKGNNMYSAGFNRYIEFAEGECLRDLKANASALYVPITNPELTIRETATWGRNGIIRKQSIELANYKCEMDASHKTFIAESDKMPYMEGHHAIPISKQPIFEHSLDVYANIICLCPICHRRIHHGLKADKRDMMNQIYENRVDKLVTSGIQISKDDFASMIIQMD